MLLSLSLAAFLITVLGNLISAVRRMETAQDFRQRALTYTQESIEMVTSLQNELFACSCSACSGICPRSDGQSCTLEPAYNSCWTPYAYGLNTEGPLHLVPVSISWQLASGSETVPTDTAFTRSITVTNLDSDPNRKKVTVEVTWQERGDAKSFQLSTLLTGWANKPPP